ncbi:MgtC/SapB family protein [Aquabacter spiritensis]|uniref:Protein MgtC n=1 Tax=Aquabacter spiritensis TaxID=933073 RepID=A0A4V2UYK5_9HYPH|nr:MgtC/SapB family protein [Aquabacter spiritensis]TCT07798.1 putative Mg2+ transporter-C (MgtC) family protein [Aquabacter spiritensis]
MQFIESFDLMSFFDTMVSLAAAFVLGTAIGAERQYRQRSAGLRTNVLVAVGAAAFVDLAIRLNGADGAVRVISYVVSGVGFLGAGVIMKEGLNVRGLNTAATLWSTAAVGACAGSDRLAEAALVAFFILSGNTLLRPLVNAINRIPIDEGGSEAIYEVRVVAEDAQVPGLRDRIVALLKAAKYPVADVNLEELPDETSAIVATLVGTAAKGKELDAVVAQLRRLPGVTHANWEASTTY